jgi:hypothetical protein
MPPGGPFPGIPAHMEPAPKGRPPGNMLPGCWGFCIALSAPFIAPCPKGGRLLSTSFCCACCICTSSALSLLFDATHAPRAGQQEPWLRQSYTEIFARPCSALQERVVLRKSLLLCDYVGIVHVSWLRRTCWKSGGGRGWNAEPPGKLGSMEPCVCVCVCVCACVHE